MKHGPSYKISRHSGQIQILTGQSNPADPVIGPVSTAWASDSSALLCGGVDPILLHTVYLLPYGNNNASILPFRARPPGRPYQLQVSPATFHRSGKVGNYGMVLVSWTSLGNHLAAEITLGPIPDNSLRCGEASPGSKWAQ